MPRSHYDVICSFGGIACWQDPIQALANIREALKPDGIFVMNHFDIDSLPGKILGDHHFEYNHASLVIFSRRTMRQCQAARIARIQAASTGGICPCTNSCGASG